MKIESGKWKVVRIGDCCQLLNGRAFKPSDWGKQGLPIVRIQNLNSPEKPFNYFDGFVDTRNLIDSGDVLLSWSGTPGTSFGCFLWTKGKAVLNQHIFKVIIDHDTIDKIFFIHSVNNILETMIFEAHGGVGLRHITKGKLEAIKLYLPPLPEQKRIVARIQECMEKVQEIERLRAETETEIKALSASAINSLDVGQYPLCEVGDLIIEMRNGRSIKPTGVNSNGTILTLGAVRSIDIDMASQKAIPLDAKTAKDFAFQKDDVFISRANTIDLVGLSGIALNDSAPWMIYPDLLIKIKVDPKKILPRYLTQALRFPSTREQIRQFAKGTSQSMVKISGAEVRKLKLPLPSLKEQQTLLTRIEGIQSVVSKLNVEQKDQNPSLIRESILRKAFAGEL